MEKYWYPKLSRWKVTSIAFFLVLVLVILVGMYSFPPRTLQNTDLVIESTITDAQSLELNRSDHIRYKHTNRYLPNCIIIGSRKSGTRALLNYLNLHPDIMTAKQEIHFFDNEENYEQGLEWYRKRMPYSFPGKITVEKSPSYFVTRGVPERVHRMNTTVKLLLIVRDPTERAVSDYLQVYLNQVTKYGTGPQFRELAISQRTGQVDVSYPAVRRSLYARYMIRWLEYFPLDQFHILSGEKLVQDPFPEMQQVETFLGLDHRITRDMFYFNATRGFYCMKDNTLQKCLNASKGRNHPHVGEDVVRKLREFYAPHNRNFYFMVKKNFGWPEH